MNNIYLPSIATDSKCSTCSDQFTKSTASSELLPTVLDAPSTGPLMGLRMKLKLRCRTRKCLEDRVRCVLNTGNDVTFSIVNLNSDIYFMHNIEESYWQYSLVDMN